MWVALAGGIGGAKLALGLSLVLAPDELAVVVNTGDDFVHLGLHVSPDLDTVMYTLAGIADPERGWGIEGETWAFMAALTALGGPDWFRLGDRDLATHVVRTERLKAGDPLSAVTTHLAAGLGVRHAVVPATDDTVATVIVSGGRHLAFQDYFVRLRCEPRAEAVVYDGADRAAPSAPLRRLMQGPVRGVVVCPSNPFLSIAPILAVADIRHWLEQRRFPVIAVSPMIAGASLKGPTAKLAAELGHDVSVLGVADVYRGLIDALVIDDQDSAAAPTLAARGVEPVVASILMTSLDDRRRVAATCLRWLADQGRVEGTLRMHEG